MTTLTLDQAAARLNCSNRTVRRLIADGELGYVRAAGKRVVREDQLTAYLGRNTVPAYHDPSDLRPTYASSKSRKVSPVLSNPVPISRGKRA